MVRFNREKDLVAIIAPASGCADGLLKLQQSVALLAEKGFKVLVEDKILAGCNLPYFAASREIRLKNFQQALLQKDVKIIWAFRGGYGCSELIFECLDLKLAEPKILIGFSDLTCMHVLFNQHYKIPSIHGSGLTSFLNSSQDINHVIDVLKGKKTKITLTPLNSRSTTIISGKTMGGNLTLMCNMLGTKLHPRACKKILILEDIDEKAYNVHRYLVHLKNGGIFDKLSAVIFGDFVNSDENIAPSILDFCQHHIQNIPAYRATGIGHGTINYPLPLGSQGFIKENQLIINSPFNLS